MASYETLKAKADKLLKIGDALQKTEPAKSRRVLRQCRHYRRLAREAKRRADAPSAGEEKER